MAVTRHGRLADNASVPDADLQGREDEEGKGRKRDERVAFLFCKMTSPLCAKCPRHCLQNAVVIVLPKACNYNMFSNWTC